MSVAVINTPPPEVEIGDTIELGLDYSGPEGEAIIEATVTALITGDPTAYSLENLGDGMYKTTFDTTDWTEGDYTIRVDASAIGYSDLLTTFSVELVEPEPPEPPEEPSFWESYGATVTGVVVVLAVIAVAAVYMYGRK
jgi:hypothetical protein